MPRSRDLHWKIHRAINGLLRFPPLVDLFRGDLSFELIVANQKKSSPKAITRLCRGQSFSRRLAVFRPSIWPDISLFGGDRGS